MEIKRSSMGAKHKKYQKRNMKMKFTMNKIFHKIFLVKKKMVWNLFHDFYSSFIIDHKGIYNKCMNKKSQEGKQLGKENKDIEN